MEPTSFLLMNNFDSVKYLSSSNWRDIKPGLNRISVLLNHFGNPQKNLKFIHVAGTNGKGSTCAYISQILKESGYKTGLFTSPYIYEFCERIQINSKKINYEDLEIITLKVKKISDTYLSDDPPTEFELITAIAFKYFADNNCDFVVCEVGMGGRFDSTNIIDADNTLISCITPIGFDHTEFLGDSLSSIAKEKAGIIKTGVPVICANQEEEALFEIQNECIKLNSPLMIINNDDVETYKVNLEHVPLLREFSYKNYQNLISTLLATYQPYNAAVAIEVCEFLSKSYSGITKMSILQGISNSYWPGRFEIIEKKPYVVIDGAHNLDGVLALKDSLKDVFSQDKFVFVLGILKDKDWESMAEQIASLAKKVYIVEPPSPRKLSANTLKNYFDTKKITNKIVPTRQSISIAKSESDISDIICACGSLYSISHYGEGA